MFTENRFWSLILQGGEERNVSAPAPAIALSSRNPTPLGGGGCQFIHLSFTSQ